MANGILMLIGAYATYLTVGTLFKKRAANSQGASIVLSEKSMSFTIVKRFAGVLATVNYDAIDKITITDIPETSTSTAEKTIEISAPSTEFKKLNSMPYGEIYCGIDRADTSATLWPRSVICLTASVLNFAGYLCLLMAPPIGPQV